MKKTEFCHSKKHKFALCLQKYQFPTEIEITIAVCKKNVCETIFRNPLISNFPQYLHIYQQLEKMIRSW